MAKSGPVENTLADAKLTRWELSGLEFERLALGGKFRLLWANERHEEPKGPKEDTGEGVSVKLEWQSCNSQALNSWTELG